MALDLDGGRQSSRAPREIDGPENPDDGNGSDSVLLRVANHRPHPAVVTNARRKNNVCATALAFHG